ncbi:hypothetical protein [Streptomyces sp. BF23-19]|uniref:WXG100-like domain-containing protein n=1 Tax=unclassified Streptomyces TaxID=2593676 RepID=UPI0034E39F10
MSGLAPDLEFIAEGMIRGSMGLIETMRGARDTAIALGHELARQQGMAGDDDAGRSFAKVYAPAASMALDKMGFSSYILGATSRGLMRNAREFMAQESRTASAFLGKQVDLTVGMGDPGADCTESYLGLGQELPGVVGETAWYDQYAPAGRSDRFRGSPEKIRAVGRSWQHAGSLLQRFLEDAQTFASIASKAHSGEAADAFQSYFKHCVGLTCPPAKAQQDEPLVTNLVAGCSQLAKACARYADHVEAAKAKIRDHKNDLFEVDMPGTRPCSEPTATTAGCTMPFSPTPGYTTWETSPTRSTLPQPESRSPMQEARRLRGSPGCRSCPRSSACPFPCRSARVVRGDPCTPADGQLCRPRHPVR